MQTPIEPTKANKYYPELDMMKGIAIFLVIMGHVIIHATNYGHTLVLNVLASVHVPAFVFVSGYLASKPIASWRKFWSGKVLQLLVPMIVVGVLFVICFKRGFTELIYNRYHDGYWFTFVLFVLFVFYALFRIAIEVVDRRYKTTFMSFYKLRWGEISISECVLGALMYGFVWGMDVWLQRFPLVYETLSWSLVTWLMPYLLLGHIVARSIWIGRLYRHKWVGLVAFVLSVALLGLDFNGYPIMHGLPKTFASVCLLYHICLYFGERSVGTKLGYIISRVGSNSLGIYLWHWFFLFPFPMKEWVAYMNSGGGGNTIWELIFVTLSAGVTLALTYATVEVLKFNAITRRLLLGLKG